MTSSPPLPATCAVAFKEWRGVCDALAEGRQSIILRKGGIAEEAGRFVPEHPVFWMYPTHVHEAQQGLRGATPEPPRSREEASAATVPIAVLAEVVAIDYIDRLEALERLADLHVWTEETVRKRFHYRQPGLWVIGVRAYRLRRPWPLAVTPEHAGCKTWVLLDEPLSTNDLEPVLDEAELALRLDRLRTSIPGGPARSAGKGAPLNG
jgi:hypothetical protein